MRGEEGGGEKGRGWDRKNEERRKIRRGGRLEGGKRVERRGRGEMEDETRRLG